MSKGNGRGGRIITGPSGEITEPEGDTLGNGEMPPLPQLRTFWVVWFNPESEHVEKVMLQAHDITIHEDGMLVFRAWKKNDDATAAAMRLPPIIGYYVQGFRQHIRFGELVQDGPVN